MQQNKHLRHADDMVVIAENKIDLQGLLYTVIKESEEKAGF